MRKWTSGDELTILVTARGVGEKMGRNMLSQLVSGLPAWEHVELPWGASYGFVNAQRRWDGASFEKSLAEGQRMLTDTIDRRLAVDPSPRFVLAGYSGGAASVSYTHLTLPTM